VIVEMLEAVVEMVVVEEVEEVEEVVLCLTGVLFEVSSVWDVPCGSQGVPCGSQGRLCCRSPCCGSHFIHKALYLELYAVQATHNATGALRMRGAQSSPPVRFSRC